MLQWGRRLCSCCNACALLASWSFFQTALRLGEFAYVIVAQRLDIFSIKELWVQELFRKGEASIKVVDTLLNWADLGTKALDKSRLLSLLRQMPFCVERGYVWLEGWLRRGPNLRLDLFGSAASGANLQILKPSILPYNEYILCEKRPF